MTSPKKLLLTVILACAAILSTSAQAAPPESADSLFSHAKIKAQNEHKHVLLEFANMFCPYCKLYERFLEDPQMKPIADKAFVAVRIDMDETPGAMKLRTSLGAVPETGFPFFAMTDENGALLTNSNRDGNTRNNIGYPALPEEIDWYIEMLKRAAPSLSPADLAATRAWLQKHVPQ